MDLRLADRLRNLSVELSGLATHADASVRSSDRPTLLAERAVEAFLAAVEHGDLDRLEDLVHPDVVYAVPGRSRAAGTYEGADAIRRAMAVLPRSGVSGLRSKLTGLVADDDIVATFHELSGVVDGIEHVVELALRFRVRDGRISHVHEFAGDQYVVDDVFT